MSELRLSQNEGEPEIFYTLQGEGRYAGEPATFLRTTNCNLQCVWCDTPYTWNFDGTRFEHEDGVKYDREQEQVRISIGEAVDRITQEKATRIVISGGEPMLQQQSLVELARGLKHENADYKIDIETNGTIIPLDELSELVNYTVSPKLASSGNNERRYNPRAIEEYAKQDSDFKFVIVSALDLAEVDAMIEAHDIPADKVYLMPEGRSAEVIQERMQWLAEIAKNKGYNLSNRLHVELWGEERGR